MNEATETPEVKLSDYQRKVEIKKLTEAKIQLMGSARKYAEKIGVSPATITNLMGQNWPAIGPAMWKKLAEGCGLNNGKWVTVHTANYKLMHKLLRDAKTYSEVYALIAPAGSSKTHSIDEWCHNNPDSYHIKCEAHWSKKEFLSKLLRSMGENPAGLGVNDLMDAVEEAAIKAQTSPVIVLDEVDKLRDELLYFFICIYNRLQGKCGILICATEYLKRRVEIGIQYRKKGFEELFSRVGGRFVEGKAPMAEDVAAIAKANGITNEAELEYIIRDSRGDLRRVERLVKAMLRKAQKEKDKGLEGQSE